MAKPSADRAYLIRCWQERNSVYGTPPAGTSADVQPARQAWRFSIEEVLHERKRRGFADLDSLLDYLRAEFKGEFLAPMLWRGSALADALRRGRQDHWLPDAKRLFRRADALASAPDNGPIL
jgi:hypothetical protein